MCSWPNPSVSSSVWQWPLQVRSNFKWKNHTHVEKVRHNSEFAFGIYWWTLKNLKIRILKKWKKKKKKINGDINILHICTKNYNHMKYSSWDTELGRFFLSFLAIFWPFTPTSPTPLTTQKTKILKKWKKHLEMSSF